MLLPWLCILGLTSLVASSANNVFTNSFLVRFHRSIDNDIANEVAARNGFDNIGHVSTDFTIHNVNIFVRDISICIRHDGFADGHLPIGWPIHRWNWIECQLPTAMWNTVDDAICRCCKCYAFNQWICLEKPMTHWPTNRRSIFFLSSLLVRPVVFYYICRKHHIDRDLQCNVCDIV